MEPPQGFPVLQSMRSYIVKFIGAMWKAPRLADLHKSSAFSKWPRNMQATLHITPVTSLSSVETAPVGVSVADSLSKHSNSGNRLFPPKPSEKGRSSAHTVSSCCISLSPRAIRKRIITGEWNTGHHYVRRFRSSSGKGDYPREYFRQAHATLYCPNSHGSPH